jgi:sporulation protein YlmC with PRC-barrel domain
MNGMKVITADAFTLGEVDGTHTDMATWQITHLDVELTKEATKELNFKKPRFGSLKVSLPITAVKKVGDVITLNKSLLEFKSKLSKQYNMHHRRSNWRSKYSLLLRYKRKLVRI